MSIETKNVRLLLDAIDSIQEFDDHYLDLIGREKERERDARDERTKENAISVQNYSSEKLLLTEAATKNLMLLIIGELSDMELLGNITAEDKMTKAKKQ